MIYYTHACMFSQINDTIVSRNHYTIQNQCQSKRDDYDSKFRQRSPTSRHLIKLIDDEHSPSTDSWICTPQNSWLLPNMAIEQIWSQNRKSVSQFECICISLKVVTLHHHLTMVPSRLRVTGNCN